MRSWTVTRPIEGLISVEVSAADRESAVETALQLYDTNPECFDVEWETKTTCSIFSCKDPCLVDVVENAPYKQ